MPVRGPLRGPVRGPSRGPTRGAAQSPLLVVFSGPAQSNTIGLMDVAGVTGYPGLGDPDPSILFVQKSAPGATTPPVFVSEGPSSLQPRTLALGGGYVANRAGVELSMLRELAAATGRTVYGIKLAVDGSSAVNHWDTNGLTTDLMAELYALIDTWSATWGIDNLADNMLIVPNQGEADTGQTYAVNFAAWESILITKLRGRYGNARILITATHSSNDTAGNVRAAQTSVAAKYDRARWVSCNDLTLRDAAHYDDQGYADLGSRLAVVGAEMISDAPRTTPYVKAIGPITVATSVQSITPTLPPHAADDILLFVVAALGNTSYTLSIPSGFAAVTGGDVHDGGNALNARLQLFWKRATSSAESAPTMADGAGDDAKTGVVFTLGNCKTSGDFWSAISSATEATDTSVSFPTLADTVVDNALVLNLIATRADVTAAQGSTWANADLSGVIEIHDDHTNTGAGYGLIVVEGRKSSHGAVAATTGTLATTSDKAMITIAIAPP